MGRHAERYHADSSLAGLDRASQPSRREATPLRPQKIIKNNKLSNLKTIELKSDEQPYIYFLFADNQKDLQKFVNKRLEELQKDGTLAKLAEKFLGNKDYIPTKDALKVPSKK